MFFSTFASPLLRSPLTFYPQFPLYPLPTLSSSSSLLLSHNLFHRVPLLLMPVSHSSLHPPRFLFLFLFSSSPSLLVFFFLLLLPLLLLSLLLLVSHPTTSSSLLLSLPVLLHSSQQRNQQQSSEFHGITDCSHSLVVMKRSNSLASRQVE